MSATIIPFPKIKKESQQESEECVPRFIIKNAMEEHVLYFLGQLIPASDEESNDCFLLPATYPKFPSMVLYRKRFDKYVEYTLTLTDDIPEHRDVMERAKMLDDDGAIEFLTPKGPGP